MSIKKKSKKKKWVTICIILIAIVGITVAILLRPATTTYENAAAKIGDITTYYSFTGNVESKNRQTVMSENIMQISEIDVVEGDTVNEGDILMKTTAGDEIKAKIGGEIVNMIAEENSQYMAGAALLEIVDYNNLEINVKVDEYDYAALEKGKEITVKLGAIDKEIKGVISNMSKEGEIMNGITFFMATIDLDKDDALKIGMSAEITLINTEVTDVVVLPVKALQFDDNNQPYVLEKDEDGTVVKTEITTGINDGTTVEVKSGVLSGETILYSNTTSAGGMGFSGGRGNMSGGAN